MTFWVIQTLRRHFVGMLLFLLASGLSLIYGLMKILNLTHGSFYLLGGYIGLAVVHLTGSLLLAVLVGSLSIALLGAFMERFCAPPFSSSGVAANPRHVRLPVHIFRSCDRYLGRQSANDAEAGDIQRVGAVRRVFYPSYRLFIIGFGFAIAGLLWWMQEGTRVGAMLRAGVDDEEIARALGINVSLLFTLVFALGAFLAALGGVMGGPIMGVYPGADFEVMLLGFVVVIIGGLGSLKGALVGGLIVGLLDNFGKVFFPEFALFTIFAPMALILAVRPAGLFGRE